MNHRLESPTLVPTLVSVLFLLVAASPGKAQSVVSPSGETQPVPDSGDAADDIAIWHDPSDPSLSLVIGTDKDRGLAVYDLAGNQRQFLADGSLNNVDIRYGFRLGGQRVTLVVANDRGSNGLAAYAVQPTTRDLRRVPVSDIPFGIDVYGCCLYQSPVNDATYFFGTSVAGRVEQWRLFDDGSGKIDAVPVRSFDVGSICEGCVADDEYGWLYVAEETVGIWRYGAEPGSGHARVMVDATSSSGDLRADVEGLAIYYGGNGAGYLIASSQGANSFVVYDRFAPHTKRLAFQIASNTGLGIDSVTDTDGIDVMNLRLGSPYPMGLFVAQDGANSGGNQNFKLVDWSAISAAASPALVNDPFYDPQGGNAQPASRVYRFGSGSNPFLLTSQLPPILGSTWEVDLDCSAYPSGRGFLVLYQRAGGGRFYGNNELLVDPNSVRLFSTALPHTGNVLRFQLPLPPDLTLSGISASAQGFNYGPTKFTFSNAMDIVLGI